MGAFPRLLVAFLLTFLSSAIRLSSPEAAPATRPAVEQAGAAAKRPVAAGKPPVRHAARKPVAARTLAERRTAPAAKKPLATKKPLAAKKPVAAKKPLAAKKTLAAKKPLAAHRAKEPAVKKWRTLITAKKPAETKVPAKAHVKGQVAGASAAEPPRPTAKPTSPFGVVTAPGAMERLEEINRLAREAQKASAAYRNGTGPRPEADKDMTWHNGVAPPWQQNRVVTVEGTKNDPFEQAYHWDDWVSGTERKYLNLSKPICVRDVKHGGSQCKLLSQSLCDEQSVGVHHLTGGFAQCMGRRSTCAVVGSSSHLLNASFGSHIDDHELVIRINAAPDGTDRPELASYVGAKTTTRFTNEYGHLPQSRGPPRQTCIFVHEPYVPEGCGKMCWRNPGLCNVSCRVQGAGSPYCTHQKCDLNELTCNGRAMTRDATWGDNSVFLDNLYSGISDQVVPHSTAGFKAVIYAMSLCKKVRIVGFGPSCSGAVGSKYYPSDVAVTGWHHYNEELMLLTKAEDLGTKAIVPPDAREWIRAQEVEVVVPKCVPKNWRDAASKLFERVGAGAMVNLVSVGDFRSEDGEIKLMAN